MSESVIQRVSRDNLGGFLRDYFGGRVSSSTVASADPDNIKALRQKLIRDGITPERADMGISDWIQALAQA